MVLTANIMLRRGRIWNLALKHNGKIFPWCLSLIPNRTSPQRDICFKSCWIDGSWIMKPSGLFKYFFLLIMKRSSSIIEYFQMVWNVFFLYWTFAAHKNSFFINHQKASCVSKYTCFLIKSRCVWSEGGWGFSKVVLERRPARAEGSRPLGIEERY